jgi:hypothetical protein
MARISENKFFKMTAAAAMTIVMVISLFSGMGAIWVKEDS